MQAENANKGVLISSSSFTAAAKRFANDKPLELIAGSDLDALLAEHGLSATDDSESELGPSEEPALRGRIVTTRRVYPVFDSSLVSALLRYG